MRVDRHQKLGIKQTIQKSWMDKTVQMMLAGLTEKQIRAELDEFLSTQMQSGGIGSRGPNTYGMAIAILSSWFAPEPALMDFRNDVLAKVRELPSSEWLPLHWAVVSSAYPFWSGVARRVGRLLNLQDQITQAQIFDRLKARYGDRETVARNARYTVRSFIAWNVLRDVGTKGCYERVSQLEINDKEVAILLIESALLCKPAAKCELRMLLNDPALFPFKLPVMSGDLISVNNARIDVVRYGIDDDLLALNYV